MFGHQYTETLVDLNCVDNARSRAHQGYTHQ